MLLQTVPGTVGPKAISRQYSTEAAQKRRTSCAVRRLGLFVLQNHVSLSIFRNQPSPAYLPSIYDHQRAHNVAKALAHFLPVLIEHHAMRDESRVRLQNARLSIVIPYYFGLFTCANGLTTLTTCFETTHDVGRTLQGKRLRSTNRRPSVRSPSSCKSDQELPLSNQTSMVSVPFLHSDGSNENPLAESDLRTPSDTNSSTGPSHQ